MKNPRRAESKAEGEGNTNDSCGLVGGESLALSSQISFGSRAGGRNELSVWDIELRSLFPASSLRDFTWHDENASFSNQKIKLQNK